MVYVGAVQGRKGLARYDDSYAGGSLIDIRLPIARVGSDVLGASMPYWPSFSQISPSNRSCYLDWLASGRSDERYGAGYVFLFFYGLEFRFFVNETGSREKRLIVAEVGRLLEIYGANNSIRRYFGEFLDIAGIVLGDDIGFEPVVKYTRGTTLPALRWRLALGRRIAAGLRLDANWLLSWYLHDPDTRYLRTPAVRAFDEFRVLFGLLFCDQYPRGLKIRVPKRMLSYTYHAASSRFTVDLSEYLAQIPDASRLTAPLKRASELVEAATGGLEKYSRLLGRKPDSRGSVEAHLCLPESLWEIVPCASVDELRYWAESVVESGRYPLASELVSRVEGGAPPERVYKKQLVLAINALSCLSIGMAPDPRFALRRPKADEPVVLFRLPDGSPLPDEASIEYRSLLNTISIGSFIAHADGTASTQERDALQARIDAGNLSAAERALLNANLQWMLTVTPTLSDVRRRLHDASTETRHRVGQVALALVLADGAVDPNEVRALEKLYKALGLDEADIYRDLHALTATKGPVLVREADEQDVSYEISPPPEVTTKIVLDMNRIVALTRETDQVATVLNSVFADEFAEKVPDMEANGQLPGLDESHVEFARAILAKPRWAEAEVSGLAKQFGLVAATAVPCLNEWSYEHHDDALVELYDCYEVNQDVVARISGNC